MIHEIIFLKEKYEKLEAYLNKKSKLDFKNDCFIYFFVGKKYSKYLNIDYIDALTSYKFITDLETRFNVNINYFDLSNFFEDIVIEPEKESLKNVLNSIKEMYINSILIKYYK